MEIVPGIHQVDGVNGNSYVIARDRITVVDTGIPGSGRKILAYIKAALHREPGEIGTIVITHFHMDHTSGIAVIKKAAPGARLAVHEADAPYVSGKTGAPRHRGAKGMLLHVVESAIGPEPVEPDVILKDGDTIDGLTCIHIPGHTPGSIALLDEATGTLFCGDILRYDGKTLAESPAGFTMDLAMSRESIRKLATLDFDCLLPGHGVPLKPKASKKVGEFAKSIGD